MNNQKHLTLSDRTYIEQELVQGSSFKSIAATLHKDPTTISKEVRKHRKLAPGRSTGGKCRKCKHWDTCDIHGGESVIKDCPRSNYCKSICRKCWREYPQRYCALYIPLSCDRLPKRKNMIYESEQVKRDLTVLLDAVDRIDEILLIGGETFLYPDLADVIEFCFRSPKIGNLIITTNGSFLPKEEIVDLLANRKVLVRVSGYPEYVVPKRSEIIEHFIVSGVMVEDLDGMIWTSMGDTHFRKRTDKELSDVFCTCLMKDCVTIQRDGKIFFCSRQISAYETDMYPDPLVREYLDVRNSTDLMQDLESFYSLRYISTCNYCDGISCATNKRVETAVQILPKEAFLNLVLLYETWDESRNMEHRIIEMLLPLGKYYTGIAEYVDLLNVVKDALTNASEAGPVEVKRCLLNLINRLSDDYNYDIDEGIRSHRQYEHEVNNSIMPNVIRISSDSESADSDLMISDSDIEAYKHAKYSLDMFSYTRLFIRSKLAKLGSEDVESVVCGLSYTQYGILEKKFPVTTVNLSVTGQDVPYQISMARHALAINPDIKIIIMPMTYYQGFYDMVNDDADIHRMAVSRVNIPVLHESRDYSGPMYPQYYSGDYLRIYDHILDEKTIKAEYEQEMMDYLKDREYFNELLPMIPTGGLKFDFNELHGEDRTASARKTAELNERIVTENGFEHTMACLKNFLRDMAVLGKKVLVFVPPMTFDLYNAYSKKLIEDYYRDYVSLFAEYYNVTFADMACNENFDDSDFCDFEHLNHKGAGKLTLELGSMVKEILTQC